jgi:integrase
LARSTSPALPAASRLVGITTARAFTHRPAPARASRYELHFLRHSHKTWLIEDGVPEIAQAKRLGHRIAGVPGLYSHVSAAVEQRLVDGLQARWEQYAPRRQRDNPTN